VTPPPEVGVNLVTLNSFHQLSTVTTSPVSLRASKTQPFTHSPHLSHTVRSI
jgi:hypothetical protein